jgi:hypothetical protein
MATKPAPPNPDKDESDALIGRTDALLKKHRPRPSPKFAGTPVQNLDIPVLTEIVEEVPAATPAPDGEDLAQRLHHQVLKNLQPQIESLVDARLTQTLADLLEQVLHGMEAELKLALRAMVRDAVAAAIDRELLRVTAVTEAKPRR